jgi:hypothetical protein
MFTGLYNTSSSQIIGLVSCEKICIKENSFTNHISAAGLAKERTEKFGGLEDKIENLQSRCAEIKEFYNADGFDFFYQTPEKEPPQEEVAEVHFLVAYEFAMKILLLVLQGLEEDSNEQSQDEVPRRQTFSASGNEPRVEKVPRSKSCSSAPAAKNKSPSGAAKIQVKSSLVVLEEDLETGLVVIGRSALLQRNTQAESDGEARKPEQAVTKLLLERDDSDVGEPNVCSPPPPPSFRH